MPVTAKLSRKFYETFGDEITNELVDWFNQVDLTYRGDLRELNELNFARFDARLEQRCAEFDAKLERRLTEFEARFEHLEAQIDLKLERFRAEFEIKLERFRTESDAKLDQLRAELIKWMFVFWIGTVAMMFLARAID
ncbi:MAG: hypothetical protein H0T68_03655 [Gemmatimonadales bacterium]|nr:hypothetical protein [Gemmatimonadales bacterium]